jgi:hypothetical protein
MILLMVAIGRLPMKAFLLLVTWLTYNQSPSNYQVPFSSAEACEAARLQVIKDAERIRQQQAAGLDQRMAALQGTALPSVSAVCVAQ